MKRWMAGLALACGLAAAGAASAAEYYIVSHGETKLVFVDTATTAGKGARVSAWVTWVYKPAQGPVQYEVEKAEFDCEARRMRVVDHNGYDATGAVVNTSGPSPWGEVVPETIGDGILKSVCRPETRDPDLTVEASRQSLIEHYLSTPAGLETTPPPGQRTSRPAAFADARGHFSSRVNRAQALTPY